MGGDGQKDPGLRERLRRHREKHTHPCAAKNGVQEGEARTASKKKELDDAKAAHEERAKLTPVGIALQTTEGDQIGITQPAPSDAAFFEQPTGDAGRSEPTARGQLLATQRAGWSAPNIKRNEAQPT
jgi:hypothetical protein